MLKFVTDSSVICRRILKRIRVRTRNGMCLDVICDDSSMAAFLAHKCQNGHRDLFTRGSTPVTITIPGNRGRTLLAPSVQERRKEESTRGNSSAFDFQTQFPCVWEAGLCVKGLVSREQIRISPKRTSSIKR